MLVLELLKFILESGSIITYVFLLMFAFGLFFKLVRR